MTTDLLTSTRAIWDVVQESITAQMLDGESLEGVKTFVKQRRQRGAQVQQPMLHTLSRVVRVTEYGGSRGVGELEIAFGFTLTTVNP